MSRLEFKTILADEVVAARSNPALLSALLERADPFLKRLAENHHRYHAWDEAEDIWQEYRETFVRCIDSYDASRSFDGLGFIAYLNWKIRTDYRSHYRRYEAARELQVPLDEENMPVDEFSADEAMMIILERLSQKDRTIFLRYLDGEQINPRKISEIHGKLRKIMNEGDFWL